MKKCLRCAAESGDEFSYCPFCGALLPEIEAKPASDGYEYEKSGDIADSMGEISAFEMKTFVGKNSDDIVKRFIFIQKTGRKAAFCPAPFLLGLFFGLAGVAAWFLYRKMKKPAIWLYLSAFLMKTVGAVLRLRLLSFGLSGLTSAIGMAVRAGEYELLLSYIATALNGAAQAGGSFGTLSFAISAILIIIFTFFAFAVYKRHSERRILALKTAAASKNDYIKTLKREGGTSVAGAVVGSLIYLGALSISSLLLIICAAAGIL